MTCGCAHQENFGNQLAEGLVVVEDENTCDILVEAHSIVVVAQAVGEIVVEDVLEQRTAEVERWGLVVEGSASLGVVVLRFLV